MMYKTLVREAKTLRQAKARSPMRERNPKDSNCDTLRNKPGRGTKKTAVIGAVERGGAVMLLPSCQ